MFKGLVRHGKGGVLSRLPAGAIYHPAINARHPLRAFLFWANLSTNANFIS
jgi:hypothetical protein